MNSANFDPLGAAGRRPDANGCASGVASFWAKAVPMKPRRPGAPLPEGQHIAHEVDAAALPRSVSRPWDSCLQPLVGVGNH